MADDSSPISVSDIAGRPMRLRWMSGDENLGGHPEGPFEYRLELLSPDVAIQARDVLGQKATIKLELPEGRVRYFNGHVASFKYTGMLDSFAVYQATLRPWLWFLNFTSDCRVFPNKSVREIVRAVFHKYGQAAVEEKLSLEYPAHEHVVQYRETDFNFVCRLLEREGIHMFCRHEAGQHTLVLADGISAHGKTPGYQEIAYVPPTRSGSGHSQHFDSWQVSQEIKPSAYALGGFDFEKPRTDLSARRQSAQDEDRFSTGELFDFPGGHVETLQGEELARLRIDELHRESQSIEVDGNTRGLGVGHIFTLANPPRSEKPIEFLVTSAHYEIRLPDPVSGNAVGPGEPFRAKYGLTPSKEPFRPKRTTPKPAILGPQTAIVVGMKKTADAEPEEIVTDPYGRVRVRFHWERIGTRRPDIRGDQDLAEEDNSCWVRVAQTSAGNRWGAIHIPRVGQEVVVEFLEGDPDRPLVTGSVYNADNMPPYELPAKKTQSGVKSRSTKRGNASNFNEIRFEDEKGREELHFQAERDMSTLVKNDQTATVEGNRTLTVTKDETSTIEGAREITVTKAVTETLKDKHTRKVLGEQHLDVGKSKSEHVKLDYTLTTDKSFQLNQGDTSFTFEGTNVLLDSAGVVTVKRGAATVSIDKGDKVKVSSPTGVSLECGSSKIELLPTGIAITAESVTASGGASKLALEKSGADLKSEAVSIEAEDVCSVMGRNKLKLNTP